ncbi:MAG: hypothetical protein ACR2OV_06550 [Hyphomicrobiaceae bacterium]
MKIVEFRLMDSTDCKLNRFDGELEIRDLADFALQWRSLREIADHLSVRPEISEPEREITKWLIQLADRVSETDLSTDREKL